MEMQPSANSSAPITIAHLSDLHLTATDDGRRKEDRARHMNANLSRLLRHSAIQDTDLVLITGDVSDRGELAAWNVLWSAAKGAGLDLRKVLVIPGNHDAACLGLRRTRPKAEDLAIVRAGLEKGRQRRRLPYVRLFAGGTIGVFAVDSVNAGNFNLIDNAVGRIGFNQLSKLGGLLRETRRDGVRRRLLSGNGPRSNSTASTESGCGCWRGPSRPRRYSTDTPTTTSTGGSAACGSSAPETRPCRRNRGF